MKSLPNFVDSLRRQFEMFKENCKENSVYSEHKEENGRVLKTQYKRNDLV